MLDLAIKIYRQRFVPMAKAVVVVVAPVAVITALAQVSLASDSEDLLGPVDATGQPTVDGGEFWTFAAGFVVVFLLTFIAAQLATATSFKLVAGAYLDEPPDWRESMRFAFKRLGALVWLTIVFAFLLVLGLLACVVPGVYLYVAWSVAVPALLLEDRRGWKALKRSKELVKGRWWSVLGAIFLSGLLAGIVQAVFSGLLAAVVGSSDNEVVNATAGAIANTASSMLTTPFAAAVIMVVYFDLRVRKEGFDLELLAQRVGVDVPPGVARPSSREPGGPAHGGFGQWPPPGDAPRGQWPPSDQPPGPPTDQPSGGPAPPSWPPPPGSSPDA